MIPLAKVKKKCRICGKEYTPCSYCENDKTAFHYRTICCSRACAYIYVARVMEARGEKIENPLAIRQEQSEIDSRSNENNQETDNDVNTIQDSTEKPKRKYTRKKPVERESEIVEQIDKNEGALD